MAEDQFFDFQGTHGFMWRKGWRCMDCGYTADSVMEANRRLQKAAVLKRPYGEPEQEHESVYCRAETLTRDAA
jgi:hypothetical protein